MADHPTARLRHLTHDIYAVPGDMRLARPWVGAVVTPDGTVLIDSGNSPAHAADIQAALDALAAPPVTHLLLTHHHWDHVFGNMAFPQATIVAHEQTQHHLNVMAGEPWSEAYVRAKGDQFPRGRAVAEWMNQAVGEWSRFRAVPATETFARRYQLVLGGYHFDMRHVGGPHELDQCIVHVEPGNALFIGDAAYGRGPQEGWGSEGLAAELQRFLDTGAEWFVEGHRSPVRRDGFARRAARLAVGKDEG